MSQRIYTFYTEIDQIDANDQRRLVSLWLDNWRDNGFDPYVISLEQTLRIPGAEEYFKAVQKFHSTNPFLYDSICFLRWFAVAKLSLSPYSILADYDCFNYSWRPPERAQDIDKEIPGLEPVLPPLTCYQGHVPALVAGPTKEFLNMAMAFLKVPVVPGEHVSDMLMLAGPVGHLIKKVDVVRSYGEIGWDTASAVHYPNSALTPANLQPKWKHIPTLRKWNVA